MRGQYLRRSNFEHIELATWLHQFEFSDYQDLSTICQKAYEARKDSQMKRLLDYSRDRTEVPVKTALAFRKARHIIGRLAQHIRAVKETIEDGCRLDNLLDVYEVDVVPRPGSVLRSQADDHTNLRVS